jgi:hypothetical protein
MAISRDWRSFLSDVRVARQRYTKWGRAAPRGRRGAWGTTPVLAVWLARARTPAGIRHHHRAEQRPVGARAGGLERTIAAAERTGTLLRKIAGHLPRHQERWQACQHLLALGQRQAD